MTAEHKANQLIVLSKKTYLANLSKGKDAKLWG